jgi:hypothetical protein
LLLMTTCNSDRVLQISNRVHVGQLVAFVRAIPFLCKF